MDDGLVQSLNNLYVGNRMVCEKQLVNKAECEKRIEATLRAIQGRVEKNCRGKDKGCEERGLEWEIDNVEIEKLKQKLLKTYT